MIIEAPNTLGESASVRTAQATPAEMRAEIGNNSFFGPIPDALKPGQEAGQTPPSKPSSTAKPQQKKGKNKRFGWPFGKRERPDSVAVETSPFTQASPRPPKAPWQSNPSLNRKTYPLRSLQKAVRPRNLALNRSRPRQKKC